MAERNGVHTADYADCADKRKTSVLIRVICEIRGHLDSAPNFSAISAASCSERNLLSALRTRHAIVWGMIGVGTVDDLGGIPLTNIPLTGRGVGS